MEILIILAVLGAWVWLEGVTSGSGGGKSNKFVTAFQSGTQIAIDRESGGRIYISGYLQGFTNNVVSLQDEDGRAGTYDYKGNYTWHY